MRWNPIARQFMVYEKGGSAPTSTTTTQQNYSPEEAAARARVAAEAEKIYGATAGQITNAPYPGAKPVGQSADTKTAQDMLRGYATGTGQQQVTNAQDYSNFLMGPAQMAESNPYLQSAISAATRPVTQAYTDAGGVMSNIRSNSMMAGGQGTSSRQGIAEGIAAGRYHDTIGDISGRLSNENYQNALRMGGQALALSPQTYNLGTQPALGVGAIGTQNESYGQEVANYNSQSDLWKLNAPWSALQNYAGIVYGTGPSSMTTTAMGQAPQTSRAQSALGGAATGAAIGSAIPGVGTLIGAGVGLLGGLLM